MIKAISLTKQYGSKTAVDHLSFTFSSGRVTAVSGPERRWEVDDDADDHRA